MTFAEKIRKLCRTSILISFIMTVVNSLYNCIRDGLFGRFFTSYTAEEKLFRKGMIGNLFSKRSRAAIRLRKIRLRLSEFFEKSLLIEKITHGASYMLGCSLRFYGIAVLTFGAYAVLIFYIKQYAFPNITQDDNSLIIGFTLLILGFLMMGSKQSVAELLQRGLIPRTILITVLGIPEERLEVTRVKGGGRYNVSLIFGLLLGAFTFLISVQQLLIGLFILLLIAIVMSYPEIGVLTLIALFPFAGMVNVSFGLLNFTISVTAIAYLGKLIRGKRIIRFSLFDTIVLLMAVLIWFSGIVSLGGEISLQKAQHVCLLLLVYFMIVNLIRTPEWLHRATLAIVAAAFALAVGGIAEYAIGIRDAVQTETVSPWMMYQSAAIFDSANVFGAYLMVVLPFCIAIGTNATAVKSRLVAAFCSVGILMAVLLTWSRSAWFGVLISLLVYFLIYSRKTLCWLVIGGITAPIWYEFLPQTLVKYVESLMDMTDATAYQQIYTWRGSVRMISKNLLGGIGYGQEAFQEVYPKYSLMGLEMAESTGSLFLTMLAIVGLLGFLVFLIMLIVFAQYCFEYIGNAAENYSRSFVAAGFAGTVGALITGIGSDIWYHETVFLASVIVIAMTCAYIRAGTLIRMRNQDVSGLDVSHAHIDLHFEV